MFEAVKRELEDQLSNRRQLRVARLTTDLPAGEADTSVHAAYVAFQMKRRLAEMYDDGDAAEFAENPRVSGDRYGGLATQRQLEKHVVERFRMAGQGIMYDLTVPFGAQVLAPPYDRDWSEGFGLATAYARIDGKLACGSKANSFSAAGLGFYLTTDEPVSAAITPGGSYNWFYWGTANLPFLRSGGGLGVTIYADSGAEPYMSHIVPVWSLSGLQIRYNLWETEAGNGRIADAAAPVPPGGVGTVPLAPARVDMVPGSRYLVWIWCWQTCHMEAGDPFVGILTMEMPFVTIEAGPPVDFHLH